MRAARLVGVRSPLPLLHRPVPRLAAVASLNRFANAPHRSQSTGSASASFLEALKKLNPFAAKFATGDGQRNVDDFYELGKELGSGRFGTVYVGTNRATGEQHAVKAIPKSRVTSVAVLTTEIELLRQLNHPNTMRLVGTYEDAYKLNIVTELYSGGELFDRIVEMGHFSEREAAHSMRQILGALSYCHDRRIVHRDVKPENLLYESNDADADLKLVDFGMGMEFTPGERIKATCGSPSYVAPEVLLRNYSEKCDVWSAGVLLHILLSGYTPFQGDTESDILFAVSQGKFSLDSDVWAEVSDEAKDLLLRMLTIDQEQRISAADALRHSWLDPGLIQAVENMRQFNTQRKLRKAAIGVIARQLKNDEDIDKLRQLFRSVDANGDGLVSFAELAKAVKQQAGVSPGEGDEHFTIHTHMDSKAMVDINEFVALAMKESLYQKESSIALAFKHFDADGSGTITKEELAAALGSEADVDEMIADADKNNDGVIDYDEFVAVMREKELRRISNATMDDGDFEVHKRKPT